MKSKWVFARYWWYSDNICLRFASDLHEICQIFARYLPLFCLKFDWDLHEILLEICLRFAWDLHEICMRFPWDFHESCMRFEWALPEIWHKIIQKAGSSYSETFWSVIDRQTERDRDLLFLKELALLKILRNTINQSLITFNASRNLKILYLLWCTSFLPPWNCLMLKPSPRQPVWHYWLIRMNIKRSTKAYTFKWWISPKLHSVIMWVYLLNLDCIKSYQMWMMVAES